MMIHFRYTYPEMIEHQADLFCAMLEMLDNPPKVVITECHEPISGILIGISVYVSNSLGLPETALWTIRQQAIHIAYDLILKDHSQLSLN